VPELKKRDAASDLRLEMYRIATTFWPSDTTQFSRLGSV
jgi:hypothetical protein